MRQLVAEVEAWLANDAPYQTTCYVAFLHGVCRRPFLESKALMVLDGLDAVAETPSFLEWLRRLCEDNANLYRILSSRQLPPHVAHLLKEQGSARRA